MAEMGLAAAAGNSSPCHAQGEIRAFMDILLRDRLPETGPAGAGFKFCFRAEQRRITADAAIEPFLMQIPVCARKWPLGSGLARHLEGFSRQLFLPFSIGFGNRRKHNRLFPLTGI